ncbi:hypothetical protein PR048_006749 [Dryococelus australis]|uniref:Transposase n=1 Tax=Dryococelus australis TaxID=614101 RepID=A0ABQ9IBT4_9NEOP|nr:hypothetical protein PR048_006749 [Dryococelus australis]
MSPSHSPIFAARKTNTLARTRHCTSILVGLVGSTCHGRVRLVLTLPLGEERVDDNAFVPHHPARSHSPNMIACEGIHTNLENSNFAPSRSLPLEVTARAPTEVWRHTTAEGCDPGGRVQRRLHCYRLPDEGLEELCPRRYNQTVVRRTTILFGAGLGKVVVLWFESVKSRLHGSRHLTRSPHAPDKLTDHLPPRRTGFDSQQGRSRICVVCDSYRMMPLVGGFFSSGLPFPTLRTFRCGPQWCRGQTTHFPPRRTGFDSRRGVASGFLKVGIVHVYSGISHFAPPFHSGVTPYSPRFTLIGSQNLDERRSPREEPLTLRRIESLQALLKYAPNWESLLVIKNVLGEFGKCWIGTAMKRPHVSTLPAATILFAKEHLNKNQEFCNNVIWPDGIKIILFSGWCPQVDLCFTAFGVGPLVFARGSMNTEACCNILDNEMLPTLWRFYGMDPCYFQDDNARGHVSRATMQWYVDNNVPLLD